MEQDLDALKAGSHKRIKAGLIISTTFALGFASE